jgi:hypothetical protein
MIEKNIEGYKIELGGNILIILGQLNTTLRNMSNSEESVIKNRHSIHFAAESLHNMRHIGSSLLDDDLTAIKESVARQIDFVEMMFDERHLKHIYTLDVEPHVIRIIKHYAALCETFLTNIK